MNLQINEIDDFDYMDYSDIDTGDYQLCQDCGEWVIPEKHLTTDEATHELITTFSCHCGAEWGNL